jgi:surface protein
MKKATLAKMNGTFLPKLLAAFCMLNCVGAVTTTSVDSLKTESALETKSTAAATSLKDCVALETKCKKKDRNKVTKSCGVEEIEKKCMNLCKKAKGKKALSKNCKKACCVLPPLLPPSPPPPSPPPPSQPKDCSGLTDTANKKKCKKVSKCTNANHLKKCKKTCCSPSPPPSPPLPPSPPSPPPSPPGTFTTKASLQTAVRAYNADPTAAIATYGPIANWDVSAITDMSWLFLDLTNFNTDISSWDTSSVTDMSYMFNVRFARALGPQALSQATSPCMPLVCRHHTPGPPASRLAPLPPRIACPPLDSAARVGLQPAAEL